MTACAHGFDGFDTFAAHRPPGIRGFTGALMARGLLLYPGMNLTVIRWARKDWRVMRSIGVGRMTTVSQHSTKVAAYAALRKAS